MSPDEPTPAANARAGKGSATSKLDALERQIAHTHRAMLDQNRELVARVEHVEVTGWILLGCVAALAYLVWAVGREGG